MAASNSIWYPTQHSFAGGEVSQRISVRQDIQAYQQSVLNMTNAFPTLQGSAERAPGLSFLRDLETSENARVVALKDVSDNRVLAILTPGKLTVQAGFRGATSGEIPSLQSLGNSRINVIKNFDFSLGGRYWAQSYATDPARPPGAPPEVVVKAISFENTEARAFCSMWRVASWPGKWRDWGVLNESWISQRVRVQFPSTSVTFRYKGLIQAYYAYNAQIAEETQLQVIYSIRNAADNALLWSRTDKFVSAMAEKERLTFDRAIVFSLPADFTGDLIVKVEVTQDYQNTPPPFEVGAWKVFWLNFQWDQLTLEVAGGGLPPSVELIGPWQDSEMDALQFVQSPYDPFELVIVHPNWPPRALYFDTDTGAYIVEELIPGTSGGANPDWPDDWGPGTFPASCTSFQGRLVFAGAGATSQTIWASEPGNWKNFAEPTGVPAADSPIVLQTTLRSAIQWMAGHKQLLVGTSELEYTVGGDAGTVLAPGNIDVRVNSGHGSAPVQPVAYGDEILFASERGSRIRAISRDFGRVGWTARDMNVLAPHITNVGVVRMARLRNPQAMLLCVLEDGSVAVLHYDRDLEFHGWSRLVVNGAIRDVAVMADATGTDVPYFIVQRSVKGEFKTYLEGIPGFIENGFRVYMDSNVFITNATSHVITGLDHLEGWPVQVRTEDGFAGTYNVVGGQITVADNDGDPIVFKQAAVGIKMPMQITTLPPVANAMSGGYVANLRYNTIVLRLRNSTAPIINGDRPADRAPSTAMDTVRTIPGVSDVKVANVGWDAFSPVTLREDTPERFELLAMSYKLASKAL